MKHAQKKTADVVVRSIADVLDEHRREHSHARVDIYRYNRVSVRIRIVDPDFEGIDLGDREDQVWTLLEKLPDEVKADITFVLLLTPSELKLSPANVEFNHGLASRRPTKARKRRAQ
jgi:hypothetical protein